MLLLRRATTPTKTRPTACGAAAAATDDGGRRARLEASRARLATLRENALFARFAEPAHATVRAAAEAARGRRHGARRPPRSSARAWPASSPLFFLRTAKTRRFLVARRSLLGLETRDGYGHLRDDAAPAASATESTRGHPSDAGGARGAGRRRLRRGAERRRRGRVVRGA